MIIDVEIVVIEIDEDVVYFKCHKPVEYVSNKCQGYGFGYSYYEKGTHSLYGAS